MFDDIYPPGYPPMCPHGFAGTAPPCSVCRWTAPTYSVAWPWPPQAKIPHQCPVCRGTGYVSRPHGVAGDQQTWYSTSAGPWPCRVCGGGGVLWG